LLDVYRAVEEGGVFALHRQQPSRRCLVGGTIESVLKDVLGDVTLAVERVLAKTTIEEVFQSVRERKRGS
jgi:DNA-binding IscR family transcriptional regulator